MTVGRCHFSPRLRRLRRGPGEEKQLPRRPRAPEPGKARRPPGGFQGHLELWNPEGFWSPAKVLRRWLETSESGGFWSLPRCRGRIKSQYAPSGSSQESDASGLE
uniref:Uncharacterized protein n=1 Tax=Oryza sativa subsp. japonica TaxID=39947 RepID=Q69KA4_ORYSJ|nr:hypothetical protein [Oryza sativa Japonica Group]